MHILEWMPHPYEHQKHLVFYDPTNEEEFHNLLEYYVTHEDEATAIGRAGYEHTLAHHMAEHRVSYIMNKVERKLKLH